MRFPGQLGKLCLKSNWSENSLTTLNMLSAILEFHFA